MPTTIQTATQTSSITVVAAAAMVAISATALSLSYGIQVLVAVNQIAHQLGYRLAVEPPQPLKSTYGVTSIGLMYPEASATVGYVNDINNSGCVVGAGNFDDTRFQVCGVQFQTLLWSRATGFHRVGDVSPDVGGVVHSAALSINDANELSGYSYVRTPGQPDTACAQIILTARIVASAWKPISGTYQTTFIEPADSFDAGYANDINNRGDITGFFSGGSPVGVRAAFLMRANGSLLTLRDNRHTRHAGNAINDLGDMVGEMSDPDPYRAFRWSDVSGVVDIGTLGGCCSTAEDINNSGMVTGTSFTGENNRAFLYRDGQLLNLGALTGYAYGSRALDINEEGQVVGQSATPGFLRTHAFVYDEQLGLADLNALIPSDSGWILEKAVAINDIGQIIGEGTLSGRKYAFLLNPTFIRGDCNGDGKIDISDSVKTLRYVFRGEGVHFPMACDSDDSGVVDISDSIYTLDYLFRTGPPPPPPFPIAGADPTNNGSMCL